MGVIVLLQHHRQQQLKDASGPIRAAVGGHEAVHKGH